MTGVRSAGRVLKFDEIRGYGFVSPDSGGEDVFLHVNDLEFEKQRVVPGLRVEFETEKGDRGLKASRVTIERDSEPTVEPVRPLVRVSHGGDSVDDVMSEVLTVEEYRREVTEIILAAAPTVSGAEILAIRAQLEDVAVSHGWIEPDV